MAFIELHEGCKSATEICIGSWNDYYTLFGSKISHLNKHLVTALVIGLLIGSILGALKRKHKIRLPTIAIVLIQILSTIIIFFLLAYFFPK